MSKTPQAMMFEHSYALLNSAQKQAVDTIEGPVMVIAGPGTGKTTILTLRIANILLRTDTPASGILALTYTDAGVSAMREKLLKLIGARAHEVGIFTFHGFAASVIASYPDHFHAIAACRQMSDIQQETLIRSILEDVAFKALRPLARSDAYLPAILSTIDSAKRDALTPEMVRSYALQQIESIQNDESSISSRGATKGQLKAEAKKRIEKCERTVVFADVYAAYEAQKRELKLIDYSDLIVALLHALQTDELLLRLLQEQYLYIHVDEHQDTNDAQNAIIEAIATFFETPNIFIVGDEKQAIYRFQGASVENFLHLQKRWAQMKLIPLDTNYRSHQGILDASFALIEHNYTDGEHEDLRVKLTAGSDVAQRPIDIVDAKNEDAALSYLITFLQKITKEEPEATIALIVRRNRELEKLLKLLEGHGIKASSQRNVDIFTHPFGQAIFDLFAYLCDPSKDEMLARTLVAGLWGISLNEAALHIKKLRSGNFDVDAQIPALAHLRAELLSDDPLGFLVEALKLAKLQEKVAEDPTAAAVWRGINTLAQSLTRDLGLQNPLELLEHMIAYRLSAESKAVKVNVGTPDLPIKVTTAHGSKGLEFDYVCIPYATESAWIGRQRGEYFVMPEKNNTGDIPDLRRLFYVALTRARKHALVLTHQEESDGTAQLPVRFIEELDPACIAHKEVDVPMTSFERPLVSRRQIRAEAITDLAKQVLSTSGLSVTALNHFLEDPKKFLLESILKLPQAPSASSEKGSAMHFAIDRVWKLPNKSAKAIETELTEGVQSYLQTSLLRKTEKERLIDELAEAAPQVANALEAHFNQKGNVLTEHWVETAFAVHIGGEAVTIPIHGKLDAIVEKENAALVFDYKTRKGMTLSAIKGETKSSSGNYFRQLVFYTKLMQEGMQHSGKIDASLVFVSPDSKGACPIITVPVSKSDLEQLDREIQTLIEYVWSGKLADITI